jgi:hypothetical protein
MLKKSSGRVFVCKFSVFYREPRRAGKKGGDSYGLMRDWIVAAHASFTDAAASNH